MVPQNDFERLLFFEAARKTSENQYVADPQDTDNLTKWGGALLELSQFQQGADCVKMVKEAISKLEEALKLNPTRHDTLWCMGNAHTSHGFLTPEHDVAKIYFKKASQCFQQALEQDPSNELYRKSLELNEKAPELHLEVHRQMFTQSGGPSLGSNLKGSKKKKNSDLKYDILGWIVLAVGVVAWVGMAKSHVPPPPPPHPF